MRGCERVECDLLDAVSCGLECGRAHRGENSRNSGGGGLSTAIPFTRRGQSLRPVGAGLYAAI